MSKKLSLLGIMILGSALLAAQETDSLRIGIHQAESEFYSTFFPKEYGQDAKAGPVPSKLFKSVTRTLNRKVLGWHPYWAGATAYLSYDYSALSHIAYFSYEVDTATGGYTTINSWNSTPIIDYAHQRGTKVLLTVTNFGTSRNNELLTDTDKQKFLINTIITLLKSRNGDGVNFDLESVSVSRRNDLVSFIGMAVSLIKAELPDAEISLATPAVDWSGAWDLKKLSELCDYLIVMGYNYYWGGSSTAGPVAPLDGESYNVTKTVITYLNAGVAPEKLLLGVPWYGYDWPVVSQTRKSATTGTGTAKTFIAAQEIANTNIKTFDPSTKVPWVSYSASSTIRQLWFDDNVSLGLKYNFADSKNLAGIGIWALSYEGSDQEVWSTINNAFSVELQDDNRIVKIYPNPVNSIAEIQFFTAERTDVSLKIFDMLGKEIIVLFNGKQEPGLHTEMFNSVPLAGGIYLCVLTTGKKSSTSKIIVIK
jgi:spore germination protein YaaH